MGIWVKLEWVFWVFGQSKRGVLGDTGGRCCLLFWLSSTGG